MNLSEGCREEGRKEGRDEVREGGRDPVHVFLETHTCTLGHLP